MKGALIQLISRGKEDIPFIGNPQFSYFKSVHRSHSNFSTFQSKNIFITEVDFGKKATCIIDKKGDLLKRMELQFKLPATGNSLVSWINNTGNLMIQKVVLKIGGHEIVSLSGEYIDLYYKYSLDLGHYSTYSTMTNRVTGYRENSLTGEQFLIVPLPFWFTFHISKALPLLKLGHMDVTIDVHFKPLTDCLYSGADKSGLGGLVTLADLHIQDCFIYCDYIYLDKDERIALLKKESIDYVIEQVQEDVFNISDSQSNLNLSLEFNLNVKELIWFYYSDYYRNLNRWEKYSIKSGVNEIAPFEYATLLFNGQDRFEKRNAEYFRLAQPLYHHQSSLSDFVYFYCFSNNCDSIIPSGTVNFSRIDQVNLQLENDADIVSGIIKIIAVNYNILKIEKGMAGLLYSS